MIGAVWRRLAAVSLGALVACAGQAQPAADLPAVFTVRLAKAAFAHDYATVWSYLHPALQKAVSQSQWRRCEQQRLAAASGFVIRRVALSRVRRVPSRVPLLGNVMIEDVAVQVLYSQRGSKQLNATVASADWVKYKGRWRTIWPAPVYRAYKAGRCYEAAIY
jgi:hypothetical protein